MPSCVYEDQNRFDNGKTSFLRKDGWSCMNCGADVGTARCYRCQSLFDFAYCRPRKGDDRHASESNGGIRVEIRLAPIWVEEFLCSACISKIQAAYKRIESRARKEDQLYSLPRNLGELFQEPRTYSHGTNAGGYESCFLASDGRLIVPSIDTDGPGAYAGKTYKESL